MPLLPLMQPTPAQMLRWMVQEAKVDKNVVTTSKGDTPFFLAAGSRSPVIPLLEFLALEMQVHVWQQVSHY